MAFGDDEVEDLLVCKECKKEMGALQFATDPFPTLTEIKDNSEKGKKVAAKARKAKDFLKSQTHCLHVDGKTVKRCRRMVYRKSGYCYVHQRE